MNREYRVISGSPEIIEDYLNELNQQYDMSIAGMSENVNLGVITVILCVWPSNTKLILPKIPKKSEKGGKNA